MNDFEALDREMQAVCEGLFGASGSAAAAPTIIFHPMRERPSARPVADLDRLVTVIPDAIISATHGRVNLGDNGMGRLSGKVNMGLAAQSVEIAFDRKYLAFEPRRQDEVTIGSDRYAVAEVMDDGGAGWSLRLNLIL